jgi:hypothetical protein
MKGFVLSSAVRTMAIVTYVLALSLSIQHSAPHRWSLHGPFGQCHIIFEHLNPHGRMVVPLGNRHGLMALVTTSPLHIG